MASFDLAISNTLKWEGGYVNNPADPGGATNLGLSLRFLKTLSPGILKQANLSIVDLSEQIMTIAPAQAKIIYKICFWDNTRFQELSRQDIAGYCFDFAVNAGIAEAVKRLQRACWAVLGKPALLLDDGVLGDGTLKAVEQSGMFLLPAYRSERANYYRAIIVERPQEKEFLDDWLKRTYM